MSKHPTDTIQTSDGEVYTGEVVHRDPPGVVDILADMILGVDARETEVTVRVNNEDHSGTSIIDKK